MRIGITTLMEHSMFSSGIANTSLAIAELMKGLGHEATLVNIRGQRTWWDDCDALKNIFKVVHLESIASVNPFDILFEIAPFSITASQRKSITARSIWVIRKPFVLQEIEQSIYPLTSPVRDLQGISEAWLLREVTDMDDATVLETIARVPVRQVPFVWTPLITEIYNRSTGALVWKGDAANPLFVPIVDTNNTNASNSTIPLVILREAKRRQTPIRGWRLHNGESIEKSKFFRENVLKHCSDLDLSGSCVGRQRSIDWVREENNVALLHIRFRQLRPVLLDLAWAGIPVVHNSPALKEIGNGAERLYYSDNSVAEGATAFENLTADLKEGVGWFAKDNKRREEILRRWSPISPYVKAGWIAALGAVAKAAPPPPPPIAQPKPKAMSKDIVHVIFSDMWESFNPTYNFFLLLLNEAGKFMTPPKTAVGYSAQSYKDAHEGAPDLVIFGPFGSEWKRFGSAVPKVHFTGENTRPIFEASVELNLGFDHMKLVPYEKYIRFPLWMTYIDWFEADVERLVNPKPMPLSWCTTPSADTLASRPRFCSFVVSNPRNPVRNAAFQWLSEYKPVDSAGSLYTNVDPVTSPFAGGGGGELDKVAFYRNYKFCLAYENSEQPGYTTEKFLHAKAAGCVPIYWGDPKVEHDFDMDGAIDARRFQTPEELQEAVAAVDADDELWKRKAAIPALKEYDVEVARRTLSEVAKRMWGIMGAEAKAVPRFLGTKAEQSVVDAQQTTSTITAAKPFVPEVPIVTTYVTWKFLGSLQHWLGSMNAQVAALPTLKAHVWNGGDIPEETVEKLQEKFPFATFETVPTTWTPPDFDDFWDPTHYAWKLWVYHTMATRSDFKDKMILYMDAGAVLCKWPMEWMRAAQEAGIALLEDPRQENERWSSEAFCDALNVTDEERKAKQIWAGSAYFRSGSELATQFFAEAFRLGQIRKVLVGPRLSGVATDGQAYGHRQDQSVLSILVRRFPVPLLPLDTIYGDHSMRKTAAKGQAIYAHRGNFNTHLQPIRGIDDIFVINLERRADRMEKFLATHPDLDGVVDRVRATDGRQLSMTPEIAKVFAPNDFFWKKAVLGCAMSHMGLWWKLVNDHVEIGNYLIFEDDAKMVPGWRDTLEASMDHVPDDYDVLYLGGILPPNRVGFERVLEPVTKYYSRIRPNSFFGQKPESDYFHSCAYAYVLSRRGASKIFEMMLKRGGFWTSADHILCGPNAGLTTYFLTPLVAGCYQDEDPVYASSEFNNFSRIDKFDSDLWNNDERFKLEEVNALRAQLKEGGALGIYLDAIYSVSAAAPAPAKPITLQGTKQLPIRFVCLKGHDLDFSDLCERDWLFRIFGGITGVLVEPVDATTVPPTDEPIFILQRPYVVEATQLLRAWSAAGVNFKILHLSDEATNSEHRDPLNSYLLPGCKNVLRFYLRDDVPSAALEKVTTIPLGYRHTVSVATPPIAFRELHWSFFGTDWMNRSKDMKPLTDAKFSNKFRFFGNWNDPDSLSQKDYMEIMTNSMFVPCPKGVNNETFRLYEALESGCIPLVIKTPENEVWFRWVSSKIPLLPITSWEDAVRLMTTLMMNQRRIEVYREELAKGWKKWVEEVCSDVEFWLKA